MDNLPLVRICAGVAFSALLAATFPWSFGCAFNTGFGMAFRGNVLAVTSLALASRVFVFSHRGMATPDVSLFSFVCNKASNPRCLRGVFVGAFRAPEVLHRACLAVEVSLSLGALSFWPRNVRSSPAVSVFDPATLRTQG